MSSIRYVAGHTWCQQLGHRMNDLIYFESKLITQVTSTIVSNLAAAAPDQTKPFYPCSLALVELSDQLGEQRHAVAGGPVLREGWARHVHVQPLAAPIQVVLWFQCAGKNGVGKGFRG